MQINQYKNILIGITISGHREFLQLQNTQGYSNKKVFMFFFKKSVAI